MLFTGRENELAGTWTFPVMSAFPKTITAANVDEFARTYARKGGRKGAIGSYRPMLTEGDEFQSRAQNKLAIPAIAVGGFAGPFTGGHRQADVEGPAIGPLIELVGHDVALEAPDWLGEAITAFLAAQD